MSRDDDAERGRAEPIDVDFEPAERGYHRAPGGIGGGSALLLAVLAAGVGAAGGAVAPRVAPVRTALDHAFPVSASADTPGATAQSEGALTQRVAALEGIVNAPLHDASGTPISPGGDTAARVFALQAGLRDVETQLSRIPSSEQVAQLVTEVRGLQEQLPAVAEQARTASIAARAAFAVAAASDASSHSGPFQESYASLQALLPQDANVLALEALSRTGAPTRGELRDRFSHLDIEIVRSSQQAQAGSGFWGRIQAMLAQWIVVRRSGEGDTPAGVVDRADQRVSADDLDGAVRELSRLSGAPRATAQPWINDAQRRIEIDRRLAAIRSNSGAGSIKHMLRLAFLLIVVVLAALASWQIITTDQGTVVINWFGTQVTTSALFAILVLVLLIALALPLLRLLMFLIDAPGRIGKASERSRVRKGQEELALGLIAAEAGEFEDARRHADKAENLVDEPRLAMLLQARAAEVGGDTAAAERAYSGMLSNEDTEVLGRKGLMAAALKRGDRLAARTHADAALKASKTSSWPFQYAFDLAVQAGDWEAAMDTLDVGDKRKLVDDRVAKRRRAVLMTAQAQKLERERHIDKAADMAQKAFRMAPAFAPAAAMAARLLAAEGKSERAAAILEEAWENGPHPALAHAYRDLVPDENREARAARMNELVSKRRDSRESKIVMAELAMERGDWGAAQSALEDAYRENPSSRICILFAQVARGRGDENGARTWLAQAAAAPREPDWSDLDPEGPAFLYDDSDWARLVYVFGDGGQLIHPRMERGAHDALGPVLALPTAALSPPKPDAATPVQATLVEDEHQGV